MQKINIFTVCLAGIVSLVLAASRDEDVIDYINSLEGNTWKAGKNPYQREFKGINVEENARYNREHLSYPEIVYPENDLPENFDAREKWSNCATINDINYQALCGSCWSFGSVEAMSDRYCIHKQEDVRLSPEDPLSCCKKCSKDGCSGGSPTAAYHFWINQGIVTGGPYGSDEGCYPYQVDPNSTTCITPPCTTKCIQGYPKTYQDDKRFGQSVYGLSGVDNIMKEIVNNGPVTAVFDCYEDFQMYKSGVYKHVTGKYQGGHAIKILGYGVEDGQDYWLVANSYGSWWGDKGFFKIAKGINECHIESAVIGGLPK